MLVHCPPSSEWILGNSNGEIKSGGHSYSAMKEHFRIFPGLSMLVRLS